MVEKVADFAITNIRFNPAGSHLACSSVANSVSFIKLEDGLEKRRTVRDLLAGNVLYLIGVLCLLLAFLYLRIKKVI